MVSEWSKLLKATLIGQHLSQQALQQLVDLGEVVDLPSTHVLFREGEENRDLYVLLQGRLDLSMIVPGRGPSRILSLGAGDVVAWSSILGDGTMTCSATAQEDSQLLSVPAESLRTISEQDDRFGREFMQMLAVCLSKRLLATRLQLLDLFRLPNTPDR
jgi:CRP/FNR family transcriptional regulator, cyclic AMP receptor protein